MCFFAGAGTPLTLRSIWFRLAPALLKVLVIFIIADEPLSPMLLQVPARWLELNLPLASLAFLPASDLLPYSRAAAERKCIYVHFKWVISRHSDSPTRYLPNDIRRPYVSVRFILRHLASHTRTFNMYSDPIRIIPKWFNFGLTVHMKFLLINKLDPPTQIGGSPSCFLGLKIIYRRCPCRQFQASSFKTHSKLIVQNGQFD